MTSPGKYRTIHALPLTAERFAPFGDVLEPAKSHKQAMNSARFERFDDLAAVDVDKDGRTAISIARCTTPNSLPYRVDMLERHPMGSQAFMPLSRFSFVIVVAPAGETVDAAEIAAFVTNENQGINYHRGVWHMPMIGLKEGQEFMIVDRAETQGNCEECYLDEPVLLEL